MVFFTYFSPPTSPVKECVGKSLARQEAKDECDINLIVARIGAGVAPALVPPEPCYADISEVPTSYDAAVAMIADASDRFLALPSRVRERFDNDPGNLLRFLGDEGNRDEAIKLGLISAPAPDPAPAPVNS